MIFYYLIAIEMFELIMFGALPSFQNHIGYQVFAAKVPLWPFSISWHFSGGPHKWLSGIRGSNVS